MADKKEIFKELGKIAIRGVRKVAPYIVAAEVYTKAFYKRTQTDTFFLFKKEQFPSLIAEKETFLNNEGKKLTGYFYHYDKYDASKVIIFAHGYGNGHRRYLDLINCLCKNGLLVFSYDLTGFDESEGEGIRSFPQAIIDLSQAISFVQTYSKHSGKDIYLCGHSMGGYAVGCNLGIHSDIKKAVIISGFNQSAELIKAHGEEWIGPDAADVVKYINAYEEEFFGKYASYSVLDGLRAAKDTRVLIIHSKDDQTVPYNASYALYYREFKDNPHFSFIDYKDRGHGTIYQSKEGRNYYEKQVKEYRKYCKDNPHLSDEEKNAYIEANVDMNRWLDLVDKSLLDKVVSFIRQ